jgi:DNA polymerase
MAGEPNDATPFLPERHTLSALREAAASCRGCHLWRNATQTVFGEGLKRSRLMLVGEIPGDREDREGRPFVGPAGRELDAELEVVRPEVLVLLGATAGKALFGSTFTLRDPRGHELESDLAPHVSATAHPSSILRQRDDASRHAERKAFRADFARIARLLT